MMGEIWDQDTGLEGLDDDVDIDEDADELAGPPDHDHDHDHQHATAAEPARLRLPAGGAPARARSAPQRRYRIQAMSPRMQRSFKDAESVLITLRGGAQILFVRKG